MQIFLLHHHISYGDCGKFQSLLEILHLPYDFNVATVTSSPYTRPLSFAYYIIVASNQFIMLTVALVNFY